MNVKYFIFSLLIYLHSQNIRCSSESITFISTERPAVYWYDTKVFKNVTLISRRLNRQDPRHYVELYVQSLVTISNNLAPDFYFYQFLTNRYRPSFVEMHFKFCDMLHSDAIFGQALRIAAGGRDCPFPPGAYDFKNMTIPFVPKGFPFAKGRIYCNASLTEGGVTKLVLRGSIDMEIKMAKMKKN